MKKMAKMFLVLVGLFLLIGCSSKVELTVKFYVDSVLVDTQFVNKGGDVASSLNPTKEGYTFSGWDKELTNIQSDLEVNAVFEEIIYSYNVKFYDGDVALDHQVVVKNTGAIAPAALSKEGYNFTGWDKNFDNVVADMDIYATYSPITYTLNFYDGTNNLSLSPSSYTIEDLVTLPNPTKEGYTFDGWYETSSFTTRISSYLPGTIGNKNLYAKFDEIETDFVMPVGTFSFTVSAASPYSCTLGVGAPNTSRLQYDWASSDASVATISMYSTITPVGTGFCVISAIFKTDTNQKGYLLIRVAEGTIREATVEEVNDKTPYTVTFVDYDDSVIDTQTVLKGNNAVLPSAPLRDNYLFYGWDKTHLNIQLDTTIKATYIAGDYSFAGKKVTILGDSVSTYLGTMPTGYAYFYPYSTSGVGDVTQMWWMQLINKLGMELLINNSYSGTTVKSLYGNQTAGEIDSRLANCQVGSTTPDYIFVFMGLNDCRANVDLHEFTAAYTNMTNKLKTSYPNATIVLGKLTTGPFTTGYGDVAGYNNAISSIALLNNFGVIDFETAINVNNYSGLICDSVHPNLAGMNAMYAQALVDLLDYKNITIE